MSRNDPLGDLLVSLRASAEQFSADMKKVDVATTRTTDAIVAGWGKSGAAAEAAVQKMERKAANKQILASFHDTTDGIVDKFKKAGNAADETGKKTGRAFDQAGSALKSLEQMLGIQLPNAAGKFLEKSSTIGPILTGAFSAIAVVGLIQALAQLPALFEKITAAITGWDEASRKAYERFIDDNKKAVEAAEKLRLKQIEVAQGPVASAQERVRIDAEKNNQLLRERAVLVEKIARIERQGIGQRLMFGGQRELSDARARLAAINAEMDSRGAALRASIASLSDEQREQSTKTFDDLAGRQKKAAEDAARFGKETADFWTRAGEEFRNRTFEGGEAVKSGLAVAERTAKSILETDKERLKVLQDAGDELIKQNEFWNKALDDFRNRIPDDVKAGEEAGRANAKVIIESAERARRTYEDVFNSVKSTASQAFLDILRDGELSFKKLGGIITGIFRTIAAEILSTMTAKLITPLVGQLTGMLGKIPGLGSILGGAVGGGGAAGGAAAGGAGAAGTLSLAKLGAFATNPFTLAAAAGIIGTTALLKSQAHHEANTFVQKFEEPFGADLDRILKSTADASDKLREVEGVWAQFSESAQQFAQAGSDEATVVSQALAHLDPLVQRIRGDLQNQINSLPGMQQVSQNPAMQHIVLNLDGRTVARLTIPHFYALTRNEGMQLVGAR